MKSMNAIPKIKSDLRQQREKMLNLLDLERYWPAEIDPDQIDSLVDLVRQKEVILDQLEQLVQNSEIPAHDRQAWLETLPAAERPVIATELEMLRELTILTLDWHQKNAGCLSLRAEELAKVLQGVHQEMAVMKALRETQAPVVRMDMIG
jgi:hypothetical protein